MVGLRAAQSSGGAARLRPYLRDGYRTAEVRERYEAPLAAETEWKARAERERHPQRVSAVTSLWTESRAVNLGPSLGSGPRRDAGRVSPTAAWAALLTRTRMTTRETSESEAERQARLTKQLLWSAAKMDAAMAGLDKFDQARTIMRMFREAEIIIGLCPDASCSGGYVRCLMKGDPNNPNAKVPIAAMFRESPEHSELTSRIYYTIMLNEDQEVASEAWSMWVDITPANVEATRSRNRAGI